MARNRPLFLGQVTYRARRMGDAARLLPVLGVILFLLPLLIRPKDPSTAFLYIFGIWALLIIVMMLMSRGLAEISRREEMGIGADDDDGLGSQAEAQNDHRTGGP
jgi:hypothetical protein